MKQRKIHEAYYVMCMCPTLNNQLELTSLTIFRNGLTQKNIFKLLLVLLGFYRLLSIWWFIMFLLSILLEKKLIPDIILIANDKYWLTNVILGKNNN